MALKGFPLCIPELQKLIFCWSGTKDSIVCENRVLGRFGKVINTSSMSSTITLKVKLPFHCCFYSFISLNGFVQFMQI